MNTSIDFIIKEQHRVRKGRRLASDFVVGEIFDGSLETWADDAPDISTIRGEILEIKPTGLCVDDGKGDESFVAFSVIGRHRAACRRDFDCCMALPFPEDLI